MQYVQFIITIIIILVVFWFADSTRKKQDKELKKVQDNIKINDKIITYSGLSGTVSQVLEDRLIVKLNPNDIEVSIEKWAVAGIDDRTIKENK